MARITPSDGTIVKLADHDPYPVVLTELQIVNGSERFPENRLELTWQLVNGDPSDTLKDWVSLKLGQMPGGDVAKLRQLLNAVVGKHESTKVEWFDDATFEWGYEKEGPAFSKLTVGLPVTIRGKSKPKESDGTMRFRIETYQPPTAGAAPPPAPRFAQISPDGRYGWDGTNWVEIPQAAPPPPPPPAPRVATPIPPPPPSSGGTMDPIPF